MEKSVYTLEEIFSGSYFVVPDYQRGFAWLKEHCTDLLDDIELLPEGFNHYTGTFVIHSREDSKMDNEGKTYNGYDIVDGQQRLTSLVILLDTIREEFLNYPKYQDLSKGIEKTYISTTRLEDRSKFFKLTLNKDCKDFFCNNILGKPDLIGPTIRSHERLLNAKKTFSDYFKQKKESLGDSYPNWLIKFYNKVVQKLDFSKYVVKRASEVGVIFEVMNNRGKGLTELEKVKNYLLYLTTKIDIKTIDELADAVNKTWSNIFERFMQAKLFSEGENQFLRAHWLVAYDYRKKEWDGSKSIKSKFNLKNYQGRDNDFYVDLKTYVKSLDEASIAFSDIENPERDSAFNGFLENDLRLKIIKQSVKLKRTRTIATFRPLLIACRLRYPGCADKYLNLVDILEKYAFRVYNIHGYRADTGQSTLNKLAYQLYNKEIDYDRLMINVSSSLFYYSKPTSFDSFWDFNENDNNWYNWWPLKYLLYEYEEFLNKGKPVQIAWDTIVGKSLETTIEHILPQTPNDKYWTERFTNDEVKIYLHDIGNLCLTYDNSSYKNKDFDRKKGKVDSDNPCYAKSILAQERILTKYEEWIVETIKSRRSEITDFAKRRWFVEPLKGTDIVEISEEEELNNGFNSE